MSRKPKHTTKQEADKNRRKLELFVKQLRGLAERESELQRLRPFPPSIDFDLVEYVAGSIEVYLADKSKHPSLDRSLALVGRGTTKRASARGKHFELAKKIFWMRWKGKSWNAIEAELDPHGERPQNFRREMQRIDKRYYEAIVADLAAQLSQRLTARSK